MLLSQIVFALTPFFVTGIVPYMKFFSPDTDHLSYGIIGYLKTQKNHNERSLAFSSKSDNENWLVNYCRKHHILFLIRRFRCTVKQ